MRTSTNVQRLGSDLKRTLPVLAIGVAALVAPGLVEASSSGAGLPWEGPLQTLQRSITGPVALTISILAVIGCGAALIWGGEINEFLRRMIMVVLVIALIVSATGILSSLFGVGAMVALGRAGALS